MTMSKVKSRWPLSPATVRAVLSGHGILGLAFAAVIYLVCLSGTLTVFVHDLERWEQPARAGRVPDRRYGDDACARYSTRAGTDGHDALRLAAVGWRTRR
ncbi:PepSY domain-containing protein [Sphingomonas aurantiaca]|uniref:PepSY domain-containing protein n=1 Tax=Sphingomonas aurantiaca TaxID=185949 RepID=UPI002FE1008E